MLFFATGSFQTASNRESKYANDNELSKMKKLWQSPQNKNPARSSDKLISG
jgi:hypothetical protein